jgi:hypothetical protein
VRLRGRASRSLCEWLPLRPRGPDPGRAATTVDLGRIRAGGHRGSRQPAEDAASGGGAGPSIRCSDVVTPTSRSCGHWGTRLTTIAPQWGHLLGVLRMNDGCCEGRFSPASSASGCSPWPARRRPAPASRPSAIRGCRWFRAWPAGAPSAPSARGGGPPCRSAARRTRAARAAASRMPRTRSAPTARC